MYYVGQSNSCSGLDNFITNINKNELSRCVEYGECTGIYCFNNFRQLRLIAEIFNFTLLPCAQPSPAVLVQLLGQQDPVHDNLRKEIYSQALGNSTLIPIVAGGIDLDVYNVTINISIPNGSVGIKVHSVYLVIIFYIHV